MTSAVNAMAYEPKNSSSGLINPQPRVYTSEETPAVTDLEDPYLQSIRDEIFDLIRHINDPEHPNTLEELRVVEKGNVMVTRCNDQECAEIVFQPTVPHCSLATLIGLCIRTKLNQSLPQLKLTIRIKEGTHQTAMEINKQINDKERATAAMENPPLRETVQQLIREQSTGFRD